MGIGTVLESIFRQLDALGRDVSARRRTGLETQALQARLGALGLSCPDDLASIYAFSDGVSAEPGETIGKITLFPGYYWVALAEALEIYGAVSTDARWSSSWLPIFASGGGDFYAVICDSKSPDFGGWSVSSLARPSGLWNSSR